MALTRLSKAFSYQEKKHFSQWRDRRAVELYSKMSKQMYESEQKKNDLPSLLLILRIERMCDTFQEDLRKTDDTGQRHLRGSSSRLRKMAGRKASKWPFKLSSSRFFGTEQLANLLPRELNVDLRSHSLHGSQEQVHATE